MEKITRFGVSIEPDLLEKFDRMMKKKGYTNRSEALRDLIREHLIVEQVKTSSAEVIGTLTMVYDHHAGPLVKRLLNIQHDHHHEILTTTHIHIDHNTCLEVLVLNGKTQNIQKLADTIKALKGIKHGELVITSKSL
ncbi:MAG: nickel-responsive transcriptional regulator NikR [Candidatus Thermoplasmatota archaeon]|nr:nickel-responsive transcriptional regulator NikR [Candidatus Thermoplasmatota archaeon]